MPRCGELNLVGVVALLACAAAACGGKGGGDSSTDPINLVIVAEPPALTLQPGALGNVEFTLQDVEGRPQANRGIELALLLTETPDAGLTLGESGGATLVTSEGQTDSRGKLVAVFRAGTVGEFR